MPSRWDVYFNHFKSFLFIFKDYFLLSPALPKIDSLTFCIIDIDKISAYYYLN